jgi:hypothetical protein
MTRHKSIRIDDELRRLITARILADNIDESRAIRDMILDGAKSPRRPVVAKLGPSAELKKFSALLLEWQQKFQSVRARLAMAQPDPRDEKLCALVAKWRKLAEELEPQARMLSEMAAALAKALMGLDQKDIQNLGKAQRIMRRHVEQIKMTLKATGLDNKKKTDFEETLGVYATVLKALEIFEV